MTPSPRAGFSLLGLLMAVTALSFLLLPMFLSFQNARHGAVRTTHVLTATTLANAQIERLRRLTYRRLETILLTQAEIGDVEQDEVRWPDIINGPFESEPERPDIVEEDVYREGSTTFTRLTFLSYFPTKNPNPDAPGFVEARRRMRIRVVVQWDEAVRGTGAGGRAGRSRREFALQTMVHDEAYNPKPSLRSLLAP